MSGNGRSHRGFGFGRVKKGEAYGSRKKGFDEEHAGKEKRGIF
jgi:hypothetical protein